MRVDRENPNKYFDESDASYEARRIWYAFKDVVLYKYTIILTDFENLGE